MTEKPIATYVGTTDKVVNRDPSYVYWISVSVATINTPAEIRIYDGFDTGGKEVWRLKPGYSRHHLFIPPINCEQGVYVELVDAFNSYTIGYASKKWSQAEG